MIYGYVRVSKNVENRELLEQKQANLLCTDGAEKIVVETDGSQLEELLVNLKPNDALHVVTIDRLTRSIDRICELADYFRENNISLYVGNQPINLYMYLNMYEIAQLPSDYDEDEDEDWDEDEEYEEIPSDNVFDLCFSILECETSHAARKIIDSFPEERLKDLALFLYHQYYNLKELLE